MKTNNIKCELSYDGTFFHGFQRQPNQRTVQGEIEKAIYKIIKQKVTINSSGRTDAGVHARKQVCNFLIEGSIPAEKWKLALNAVLPDDIVIIQTSKADQDFHARYDVREKIYRYYINNSKTANVFNRNFTYQFFQKLDIEKMKIASKLFLGTHDFTTFASTKTDKENKIRTISQSDLWIEEDQIIYQIAGNGFLYNMVRIIVGTLIEVGKHKIESEEIEAMFSLKRRNIAGPTVPAKGLILWDVHY